MSIIHLFVDIILSTRLRKHSRKQDSSTFQPSNILTREMARGRLIVRIVRLSFLLCRVLSFWRKRNTLNWRNKSKQRRNEEQLTERQKLKLPGCWVISKSVFVVTLLTVWPRTWYPAKEDISIVVIASLEVPQWPLVATRLSSSVMDIVKKK